MAKGLPEGLLDIRDAWDLGVSQIAFLQCSELPIYGCS